MESPNSMLMGQNSWLNDAWNHLAKKKKKNEAWKSILPQKRREI